MTEYALCPFYEKLKQGILYCENGSIEFPKKADKDMWLKMHCCSWNFKICVFYKKLMKKYDNKSNT